MNRLQIKRSIPVSKPRLISALLTYLPGAWFSPSEVELISLYRLRYKMALEAQKYDTAMIFLNKILEVDPMNLDAKFSKADLYHRHLGDFSRAIDQYNKLIRLTASEPRQTVHAEARKSLSELMEMLS